MTHQFKFGDRVRLKDDKEEQGFILDTYGDGGHGYFAVVIFKEHGSVDHEIDEIEPVPHPDTARLDWLAGPANKIGSVILPTECVEQHLDSMRDAIDAAMSIQAAEAV